LNARHFSEGLPPALWKDANEAASSVTGASDVVIATHIDADGIAAAAIASTCLDRLGTRHEVVFLKKLDEQGLKALGDKRAALVWFTDLGSGSLSKIHGMRAVVSDHHVPDPASSTPRRGGQLALTDFGSIAHVNPQAHGISGATDLSGAGSTFLVAAAISDSNLDLAPLALIGAVGDLQDQKARRLTGLNRLVLSTAESLGHAAATDDISFFGRETRPIHKMLEYSSDPFLPGITNNEEAAISFLLARGLELKVGETWRSWNTLTPEEKSDVIDGLRDHLHRSSRRPGAADRLTGEAYTLTREAPGTPMRDAKEYATLLNACGRHGQAQIGLRICKGDRGEAFEMGKVLLRDHRSALSEGLNLAREAGVTRMVNIQFFDTGDGIEETIVGTVAGMLLNSNGSDRSAPMVALAESTECPDTPQTKASARATQDLVSRGVDLAAAMRAAAEKMGGVGGGHNIAAGATIPSDRKEGFLKVLDEVVGQQILSGARRRG